MQLVVDAQLLGGSATLNFLRLPSSAASCAKGGLVVAIDDPDLSDAAQNPALMRLSDRLRMQASFMHLPGGGQQYTLIAVSPLKRSSIATGMSLQYIDQGDVASTDASGNSLGRLRSREWSLQLLASMPYKTRWAGGAAVQLAHASYGNHRASSFLSNIGIQYRDTAQGWFGGAVLRHAGFFIRRFSEGDRSELPIELAVGVWKKLIGSPFSVGCTFQRMQRWETETDALFDPSLSVTGIDGRRATFLGQFFNHLILSARIEIHPRIQFMGGYNFLRRRELVWAGGSNGLTGLSYGFLARLDPLRVSFGRAHYQAGAALSQLSLEFSPSSNKGGWKR